MIRGYFIITFILVTTHLFAETPKRETSLFLEYEREVSRSIENSQDDPTPFKKIVNTITPAKPKTPYVITPPTTIEVATPTAPKKPPIGHDDLPYLVISKPVSPRVDAPNSCPDPIQQTANTSIEEKPKKSLFANITSAKERVLVKAKEFLGTPYGFGNKDSAQTDCSGFTQQVYKQFGVTLPRSAAEQARLGTDVDANDLQVGDLLFYQTYKSEPSHVAIYAGEGQIIHASYRNKRVQYDAIDKGYYKQRFMYAKRLALNTQDLSNE
jgi:cell wall-associated NlpC family hydrolase